MSREAFEKWYAREFKRMPNNDWHETYIAWEAWQAALQHSGEPVGVIDNSMRAGVQLTEAGESLPHGTKLYATPQPVGVQDELTLPDVPPQYNQAEACAWHDGYSACHQDLLSAGKE